MERVVGGLGVGMACSAAAQPPPSVKQLSPPNSLAAEPPRPKRGRSQSTDDDYDCVVCCDLLLDPVVAPCGHDICSHCYHQLLESCVGSSHAATCPMCRSALPSVLGVCLRLKRTIDKLHPDDVRRRREEVDEQLRKEAAQTSMPSCQDEQHGETAGSSAYPPVPCPSMMYNWSSLPFQFMAAAQFGMMMQHAGSQGTAGASAQAQHYSSTQPNWSCGTEHGAECDGCLPDRDSSLASWRSGVSSSDRLQLAGGIIRVLRARGLQAVLGSKFADAVRVLELMLFRSAVTKAAYLDAATLDSRIVMAVRQRSLAATARRARLHPEVQAAAVPSPVAADIEEATAVKV
uniref:RING-type domain-containing protein n=1 Tax=Chlamydomonas euryale TaxID=1486919 RepID=A0A7R9YVR7_9CHLO|mmetsp:Transcript_27985/g.82954  ORF Transcript_27985/g.82954 Transcript_27985/m.82954 type:complete len:346 (+) Transcript_27985:316-1353(+)